MNNRIEEALTEYMKLPYTIILRRDEEGDVMASIKEFEGCIADGVNEVDALSNLEIVKSLWIQAKLKSGIRIPQPEAEQNLPSGKWLQRVPRSLHQKLISTAENEDTSLNQFVTSVLAEAIGQRLGTGTRTPAQEPATVSTMTASAYTSFQRGKCTVFTSKGNETRTDGLGETDSRQWLELAAEQCFPSSKFEQSARPRSANGY